MRTFIKALLLPLLLLLASCTAEFEPISYGQDACAHCKMTIIDRRYAAEILTKKGRPYKFDDIFCLRKYMKDEGLSSADLKIYVAEYDHPENNFLDATKVTYIHNDIFKSPMNGGFAAFATVNDARPFLDSLHTTGLLWENLN